MGRPRNPQPAYQQIAIGNRARVRLYDVETGKTRIVWLGKYDSPLSRERYARTLAEWYAAGQRLGPARAFVRSDDLPTVAMIVDGFLMWAKQRYRGGTLAGYKAALAVLHDAYGSTPARAFGPNSLRALRAAMVAKGWRRSTVVQQCTRAAGVFAWAASYELIPPVDLSIEPLAPGEGAAVRKVAAVPRALVARVRSELPRQARAILDMQLLTGARISEILSLRPCDLDTSGRVWLYRPELHKTAHRGRERVIPLSPKAVTIVKRWMRGTATTARVFDRYGHHGAFRQAVRRACEAIGITPWTPRQIRKLVENEVEARHGLEAARRLLGHGSATTTRAHYSEINEAELKKLASKIG